VFHKQRQKATFTEGSTLKTVALKAVVLNLCSIESQRFGVGLDPMYGSFFELKKVWVRFDETIFYESLAETCGVHCFQQV